MTALAILAAAESTFTEELHPRGSGAQGGQFVAKGSSSSSSTKGSGGKGGSGKSARAQKMASTLSWDPQRGHGSGYGHRGGDSRVRKLQAALNALGIHDAQGKPLAVDGDFGPKTSSAVRALQQRLGLPADGKVTPQLLAKVLAMPGAKAKPKPKPKGAAVRHREAFAGAASLAVQLMMYARTLESSWNAALHPRLGKGESGGGRFTSGSAVAHALASGAADALDGFNREQLRREAKRRGLTLRRGAPIDEIRDMLHDHHGKSGGKGGDTPDLPAAAPHKAQAAAAAALSPDARGESGVRTAYTALAARPGDTVSLADLRLHMGGSRAEQDRALNDMALRGEITLWPEENQKRLTPTDHAAALRLGGEEKHLIMIEGSAPKPATSRKAAPDALAKLLDDRGSDLYVSHGPSRAVLDAMRADGWELIGTRPGGMRDWRKDGRLITTAPGRGDGLAFYADGRKLTNAGALAHVKAPAAPARAATPTVATPATPSWRSSGPQDFGHGRVGPTQIKAGSRVYIDNHFVEVLEAPRRARPDKEGRTGWVFQVKREDGPGEGTVRLNDGDQVPVSPPKAKKTATRGRGRR